MTGSGYCREEEEIQTYDRSELSSAVLGPSYQDIIQTSSQEDALGESSSMSKIAERDYREFLSKYDYDDEEKLETSYHKPLSPTPTSPQQFPLLPPRGPQFVSRLESSREILRTLFSLLLVICETLAWVKVYGGLASSEHETILYLLCLPSLFTSLTWLAISCRYTLSCSSSASMLVLLVLSVPSPVLLLLHHLYNTLKAAGGSQKCRPLTSLTTVIQLCRALTSSLPLAIYGQNYRVVAIIIIFLLLQEFTFYCRR